MRPAVLACLAALAAAPAFADHRSLADLDDYPGSIALADDHGRVVVKIVYQAQETCWRIAGAREGVPNAAVDQASDRHLYITVAIEKTADPCQVRLTPIETRLAIADKPGRISLDVFFVDERGVYQRSQRHRIQR